MNKVRLTGTIHANRKPITGKLPDNKPIAGSIPDRVVYVSLQTDAYLGPTRVTPEVWEQELATKDLRLTENIIVNKIPYAEVSNNFGGKTVTIGGV